MMATEISFFCTEPRERKKKQASYPDYPKLHTVIPSASEGQRLSAKLHSHERTGDNFSPTKTLGEGGLKTFHHFL